ncbi:hypothetical protein [Spiroplasma endosymbiont of Dioctria linearis]|uniref:hypothetical protein n=1 Tax=Spiroplasma endosymbiont of Dioctria linearis TaxID=3066290 RepID=UPI00313D719A
MNKITQPIPAFVINTHFCCILLKIILDITLAIWIKIEILFESKLFPALLVLF